MANLTETSNFDSGIYKIETTDLVIGGDGVGDIANKQAKALANRTKYLYDNMYRLRGVVNLTATTTLTLLHRNFLIELAASGHTSFTLPDVTSTTAGDRFVFSSLMPYGKCASILFNSSQNVKWADGDTRTVLYMYGGERLELVSAGTYWTVGYSNGNFDTVGESRGVRKRKGNTLVLDGTVVNRTDYPRLWEFIQSFTTGQDVVTDANWLAGTGGNINAYRGCFSLGNGATTFRLPDERGLFDRYLDLTRGLDTGRIHEHAGGLEMDEVLSHNHINTQFDMLLMKDGAGTGISFDNTPGEPNIQQSGQIAAYGGSETRPKNIGKIPVINF